MRREVIYPDKNLQNKTYYSCIILYLLGFLMYLRKEN